MSEPNETALDALQELQTSIAEAVAGTVLTISYSDEELESKTVLLEDLISLDGNGVTYLEAGVEVVDAWEVLASVKLTEPSDVVEIDV